MIGVLVGGVFNFMLGDQGADTPAFSIYGGALAFAIFLVWGRWKAWKARDD